MKERKFRNYALKWAIIRKEFKEQSWENIWAWQRNEEREEIVINGCKIHNTSIPYLCVIAGNSLFAEMPKLGQKNLFEINLKKLFLIHCKKLKTFRSWAREE
jgi:hypothetical protein